LRAAPCIVLLFAVLGSSLGHARAARAQALSLDWKAPAACPNAQEVRTRALDMLAKSAPKAQSVRADGSVQRKAGKFVLTLRMSVDGHDASKKLEAPDCDVLADTAAWLVAVAIDPNVAPPKPRSPAPEPKESTGEATTRAPAETRPEAKPETKPETKPEAKLEAMPEAKPVAEPEPEAEAKPEPEKPVPPSPPKPEREPETEQAPEPPRAPRTPIPLGFALDAWTGVWVPGLAGPMLSLGGRIGLNLRNVRVAVRYMHRFERSTSLHEDDARAEFSGDELAALAGIVWGDRVQAGPYAGLAGERLKGSASGITNPENATRLWLTLEVGGELRARLYRFVYVLAQAGLSLPLTPRPVFQVTGLDHETSTNLLSVSANLGVGISFR
jgi:hypothetical protein